MDAVHDFVSCMLFGLLKITLPSLSELKCSPGFVKGDAKGDGKRAQAPTYARMVYVCWVVVV
jgi:hypothetical protein